MKLTPPHPPFTSTRPSSRTGFKHRLNRVALAAMALLLCAPALAEDLKPQPIGTYARLLQVLKEHQPQYPSGPSVGLPTDPNRPILLTSTAATAASSTYSQTLVQVAGVDEADQVKNDETHIYRLEQNQVSIIRAWPDSQLGLKKVLDFSQDNFSAEGLFLDSQFLVVVGQGMREPIPQQARRKWARQFPFLANSTVQAKVYDIAHPEHPRKVREVEIDGSYLGARKVGSTLYLVSRHHPLCYEVNFQPPFALRLATPGFRDSRHGKGFHALGPQCCYYLPGFYDPNYLVVAAVDLANAASSVSMSAYLGAGDQLYASPENLYVTASRFQQHWQVMAPVRGSLVIGGAAGSGGLIFSPEVATTLNTTSLGQDIDKTELYKFSLAAGKPRFVAAGSVPGTVLNSYSMDENNGYLRVATTCQPWSGGLSNQLYVLDANLNLTGKLEDIAPGERIYSARFLSNRLFLVTFRQMDPLFAIDLSNPAQPVLAGELTLPGFSNFLLPYDDNHLIGLGKEVDPDSMFPGGMKLALFDVSDLAHPTLLSSVSLGDRGTDSPALQDPHALLFDRARNLLAFPISLTVATNVAGFWQYGLPAFQGVYVFDVSPEAGFALRGSVTHMPDGSTYGENWTHQISRVLTIGSDLFTLSSAQVKANDLETLVEKARLNLLLAPAAETGPSLFRN